MPFYRFYQLDAPGRCVGFHDQECADDVEAQTYATSLEAHRVEIWSGDRRVSKRDLLPNEMRRARDQR